VSDKASTAAAALGGGLRCDAHPNTASCRTLLLLPDTTKVFFADLLDRHETEEISNMELEGDFKGCRVDNGATLAGLEWPFIIALLCIINRYL
jgi:hypothetical protein